MKEKLDEALRDRITQIEIKKQKEQAKIPIPEKMNKREKGLFNRKKIEAIESNVRVTKRSTLKEEESEIYKAYQLILAEHHSRVRKRVRQKVSAMNLMKKINISTPKTDAEPNPTDEDRKDVDDNKGEDKIKNETQGINILIFWPDRMRLV